MNAQIRFHGAAREVTGSMHLIEANGHTLTLDCGLFQGRRAEAKTKNRSFPCSPSKIDAVVLSHAHIDHCGRLPRLVQEGFAGPIYATPATCDLVRILLADSAHIQQEDANYWNKKRVKRGDSPIEPLYTQEDVDATIGRLQPRRLRNTFDVLPGIRVRYHEAGHMLGSAGVCVEIQKSDAETVKVVFSGDVGRPGMAILKDPAPMPDCDYLICESTYGGRTTPAIEGIGDKLAEIINDTVARGGKLVVPAFAVGRTQVIAYEFHKLRHANKIPDIPLVVDSPLAFRATEVFKNHPNVFDKEAAAFRATSGHIFECARCEYIESVEQSKALNQRDDSMMIVSASGMCEAGRILHHLKNNLEDPRNTVLIVGYQAAHTLGRRLVEGVKRVRIFGEQYAVKAKVAVLNGFSAHANADELLAITTPLAKKVRRVFLVHGEPDQAEALATSMRGVGFSDVQIPSPGDAFPI